MTVQLRLLKQSCVLIESDGKRLLIDPGSNDEAVAGLGIVDGILLSHHHSDHLNPKAVGRVSDEGTRIFGPGRTKTKITAKAETVAPGDQFEAGGFRIKVVDAYNPKRALRPTFHKKGECVGYVIEAQGKHVYHAGDTGLIDEMNDLGPIDVAFLPIGGTFTMNIDQAVDAVKRISPKAVVPMHMLRADPDEFREKVGRVGQGNMKVVILRRDDVYNLD